MKNQQQRWNSYNGLECNTNSNPKKKLRHRLQHYERINKFKELLKNEHVYGIPLRYFIDIGKINFPTKIDYRIKLHLEKEMKKLLESRKVLASGVTLPTPNVKIIFTKTPYIQYEQILLDKIFR